MQPNDQLFHANLTHWEDQLRAIPSLTTVNVEELKNHLLDAIDALKLQGYGNQEAFALAVEQLGDPSVLAREYEEVNSSALMMRKSALGFAGILLYYVFNLFIFLGVRILFYDLIARGWGPISTKHLVQGILLGLQFLITVALGILYFKGERIINRLGQLRVKPKQILTLLLVALVGSYLNFLLEKTIQHRFDIVLKNQLSYSSIIDYNSNGLTAILGIGFWLLLKNHFKRSERSDTLLPGLNIPFFIVFSGVLFYSLFSFTARLITRIFITVNQFYYPDPDATIHWGWSVMLFFHLLIGLFTLANLFYDINLVKGFKQLVIKPRKVLHLLVITLLIAIAERCFFPISRNAIGDNYHIDQMEQIFKLAGYSLPLLFGFGLYFLFLKYYADHIKFG